MSNLTNNAIPRAGAPSLSALAREHGLSPKTVHHRWNSGDREIERLSRPPENRGKPIKWCGKTFERWQTILAIHGKEVHIMTVKNYYYTRLNKYGDTPEKALDKAHHGIK